MYNLFTGSTEAATIFHATSCRLVMMLGAHIEPTILDAPPGMEDVWPVKRYLRRVFWLCYMNDKDMALRMGSPPVIDDDHCNLELPPGYKEIEAFDTFQDRGDLFPGDVRLSMIKSMAIRMLFSVRASKKSDASLLRDIRVLDEELEKWRLSISPPYRPTLANSYRIQVDRIGSKAKNMHITIIHLEYYCLVAMVHGASSRCQAWTNGSTEDMVSINSSQALALQASRATIRNLHAVSNILNWGDFWLVATAKT
jgi:hypothetical protein